MSDGHFNRTFLPRNEYQSALKIGRHMERALNERLLKETLEEVCKGNTSLQNEILTRFKKKLQQQTA